jgi:hypothetical protein
MQEFLPGDRLKVRLPLTAVRPTPDTRYENGPYAKIPEQSVLTLTDNKPLPAMIEVIDEQGAQFAVFLADLSPRNVQRSDS